MTETTQLLVSIIIPIYNVETYVGQCIESIQNQSYKNIEILLIDDGSTDRSGEICQKYASTDERIHYYYKENGGLSDARNYGIERATGEYFLFVDSDDWIELDTVEQLYIKLKEYGADIAIGSYYDYREEDATFLFHLTGYYERLFSSKELLHSFNELITFDATFNVVWGKLYKASLFQHIRFRVGSYTEDEAINYRLFLEANKIIYLNHAFYAYRRRVGTLSQEKNEQFILDTLKNLEERIAILAMIGEEVSAMLPGYQVILERFEHDLRVNLEMKDTELYRRVQENLYLIYKYSHF